MDDANVDDVDARFFTVACSAYVSWSIEKAGKVGLLKNPEGSRAALSCL